MANVISVTALNRYVRQLLEKDAVLTDVALRGEISNFKNHFKTGHLYFSLRDTQSSVKAVMFRTYAQRLRFAPQDGMRVIVRGRISLYERDGAFQIYVDEMFPDGVGAMQMAFEQLKAKLAAEGLFDESRKRPLPAVPKCVGLVTSKTGAAIQDILNVTGRRYPLARILLASVNVQGPEAAPEIAAAIRMLSSSGLADVIIVARGGGSQEDLWVFNDERIARAAAASAVPVVSAIGHEIDFCILDFAADLRAPTPSAAAEIVMPDLSAVLSHAVESYEEIQRIVQKRVGLCYNKLEVLRMSPVLERTRTKPQREYQELSAVSDRIQREMHRRMDSAQRALSANAALCESLSPLHVLSRGYSIARCGDHVLRRASEAQPGDLLDVILRQGSLRCMVQSVREGEPFDEEKQNI